MSSLNFESDSQTLVGLGGNYSGPWGKPHETIARVIRDLAGGGITVKAVSQAYETAAMGRAGQPNYVNAVALIETAMPPEALLRRLKQIERAAGRRGGSPWGPRTLDIDILDYKGRVLRWRGRSPGFARAGGRPLVLPHPWIDKRPFVLAPLLDVAPAWRHPVTKMTGQKLWKALSGSREGCVMRTFPGSVTCQPGATCINRG